MGEEDYFNLQTAAIYEGMRKIIMEGMPIFSRKAPCVQINTHFGHYSSSIMVNFLFIFCIKILEKRSRNVQETFKKRSGNGQARISD